jgi:aminoglycoside phosphotransferase (APT) family kinase protein
LMKMHPGELEIDKALVSRLIAAQFPEWAHLPLTSVLSAGTDNALFRLGDAMVVRLPRIGWASGQPEKEFRYLGKLALALPLAIPVPLVLGEPGEDYPHHWSVCPWIKGEIATLKRLSDPPEAVRELARFISALQRIDSAGGPTPGAHNSGRGVPLKERDEAVRTAIAQLTEQKDSLDSLALLAAWDEALGSPAHTGPPVWLHGDLQSGNLLAREGRLCAVIDFGCLGIGDPACDLQPAWNLFGPDARRIFRDALAVDDATWTRGRGWALSVGLIALPYYKTTAPAIAEQARRTIEQILLDVLQPQARL